MKPVNSKSLFSHICDQMEKLNSNEIDVQTAREQANLVKQANNLLKYELDRAKTQLKLSEYEILHDTKINIRNIESKNFET
ncbi:MAG: hypothetical protein U9R14_04340 [Patescibacteria group bacterium]|nr:hypothetical protein [Patescibacteria group bacterium]